MLQVLCSSWLSHCISPCRGIIAPQTPWALWGCCMSWFQGGWLQVLAPCALTLEGTLLGAQAFAWVGARTIAGAAGCGGVLWAAHRYSWGLPGAPCLLVHQPEGTVRCALSSRLCEL